MLWLVGFFFFFFLPGFTKSTLSPDAPPFRRDIVHLDLVLDVLLRSGKRVRNRSRSPFPPSADLAALSSPRFRLRGSKFIFCYIGFICHIRRKVEQEPLLPRGVSESAGRLGFDASDGVFLVKWGKTAACCCYFFE